MRKVSFKKQKFEERIQNEVNSILRYELSDKRLTFVSVTKVELSADFSMAKIYWDSYNSDNRGDCKQAIDSLDKKIRSLLAAKLNVRHTPSLTFHYDSQFEEEGKISAILDEEKSEGKFNPDQDLSEIE